MPHVVTGACLGERYGACTDICPCECFHYGDHEGAAMMVIEPSHCIDCGACIPECPVAAIVGSQEESPEWAAFNEAAAAIWPNAHAEPDGWEHRSPDEPPLNPQKAP